jgi:1,4-alpha-glucan branching enzyme
VMDSCGGSRRILPLAPEEDGYFSATVNDVRAGDRYWFRLDGEAIGCVLIRPRVFSPTDRTGHR